MFIQQKPHQNTIQLSPQPHFQDQQQGGKLPARGQIKMPGPLAITLVGLAAAMLLALGTALGQVTDDSENPAINYVKTAAHDPITRLQEQIDRGEVKLPYEPEHGYLRALLRQLKIPASSQMLVFSRTSFQRDLISPRTPRALYFNDGAYVGWVQQGPVLEVATVDPQLGAVFYLLPQRQQAKPKFVRQSYECLQCHNSTLTQGVPGFTMRSVYPDISGQPLLQAGSFLTTDQSPLTERWGGWYVTGQHGPQRHMGNSIAPTSQPEQMDLDEGANVSDLRSRLTISPYLTRHSDIVALMVCEHQTHLQNLITRASYQTRMALRDEQEMNKALGRPASFRSESTLQRIKSVSEPLVQAMLFAGEAPLTAPVTGLSGFTNEFAAQGPRDHQNRSLRQFDLNHRLFRYPCSYLIYSEEFNGLPDPVKDYIYRRLWEVLSGQDQTPTFAYLTAPDRQAILEILKDTKPDFATWKSQQAGK